MNKDNSLERSSSQGLIGHHEVQTLSKKIATEKVSSLVQNARKIYFEFKKHLKTLEPAVNALKLKNDFEKEKMNEESDINKLLRLKKQEITLNEEYKSLKKNLKERLEDIQTKEDTFKVQAEEIIASINQDELTLIQKCHTKQFFKNKRTSKKIARYRRCDQN